MKHLHMGENTLTPYIAGQQSLEELELEKDERVSLSVGHRLGPADNLSEDVVAVGEHHVQNRGGPFPAGTGTRQFQL